MQIDLFSNAPTRAPTRSIVWDGKKMPVDEAIKWVKLQINLAPSHGKYRQALDYLESLKGKPYA